MAATNRVGCLLIPLFPLACELAADPELRHRPVVVSRFEKPNVWVASPEAERLGVAAGQPLREALGRCLDLVIVDGRPAHYEKQAEAVLSAIEAVAGAVEPSQTTPGVAYVEMTARGPAPSALLGAVPAALGPRLGVAPSKFAALVAATTAGAGQVRSVAAADVAELLGEPPIEVLPLSDEARRRLRVLGVATTGRLRRLRRSALVAQFGPEGGRAWDLANGIDFEPVRPRPPRQPVVEHLAMDDALVSREAVLVAAEHALNGLLRHPARRGRAARQVVVRVVSENGGRWQRVLTAKEPLVDRGRLWQLIRPALVNAALPGPVTELSLELEGLTAPPGRQGELLARTGGGRARRVNVEESLRQLKARYGRCPVGRVLAVEPWSRIPERRQALIDLDP
jgi:nucleotidyltransferase/DNA polymerase involved in DNA repair